MHEILKFDTSCPVCAQSIDLAIEQPAAVDRSGGREYLQALCDKSGTSFDQLTLKLKIYQCGSCRGYFFNPWLSESARNSVFIIGHPIHNVGWRNYQERREQRLNPNLQVSIERLLQVIASGSNELASYVEIGCPFQGLLLHFADDKKLGAPQNDSSNFSSMRIREYRRFLPSLRLFMRLGAIAKRLADVMTLLQRRRHQLRGRWHASTKERGDLRLHRYFVPLQSSKFWGANCAMYGNSCVAVAHQDLGAEVLTFEQFVSAERTFDVVGLFNVLDHQDSPLKLLQSCLNRARVVLCLSHESPFAPQHHIGLGREFFESLEQTISGCQVTELSQPSSTTVLFSVTLNH